MKKLLLLLLLISTGAGIFYACQRVETVPSVNKPNDTIPSVLQDFKVDGISIPNGTRTLVDMNGARIRLLYPKGTVYVPGGDYDFTPVSTNLQDTGTGSYTCTGQCSDGCNVFYVQGSFACSQCKNGAACTGKASLTSDGGFVNLTSGIKFLATKQQAQELETANLQAPDNLFKFKFVRDSLQRMNLRVHGVRDPSQAIQANPKGYRHVGVSLFGFLVDYTVPVTFLERVAAQKNKSSNKVATETTYKDLFFTAAVNNPTKANLTDPNDGADNFTCSCTSGTTGCTAESGFGYKMCRSGSCDSCKMTVN